MAYSHGKDAVFKLTSGGTLRDFSPYLTGVKFPREADTAEVSTLGDSAKERIAGLTDASVSGEGKFEPTPDAWLSTILGGAATAFEWHPQGTASGNIKYTGSCILTSYESDEDIGDAGSFSFEAQVSGAVTRGTN